MSCWAPCTARLRRASHILWGDRMWGDRMTNPRTLNSQNYCLPQVLSPMSGTMYRSPAPGEPPFVKEGDRVTKGQTIAIIEAMKLMNEIEVRSLARATLCALLQRWYPAFNVVCQPAAAGDAP